MLKTETLRYRPRSLSYAYDRNKCQHPNLRPLGLLEREQLLLRPPPDFNDDISPDGTPRASIQPPKLPVPHNPEEWDKVEQLRDMTNRQVSKSLLCPLKKGKVTPKIDFLVKLLFGANLPLLEDKQRSIVSNLFFKSYILDL